MGLWSGAALAISLGTIPLREGYNLIGWLKWSVFGVPLSFWFALLATGLLAGALRWLPFGRQVYAIGIGETAALLSGVRTVRVKTIAYGLSGLFAGLAAVLMVASNAGGHPILAHNMLLPAIAAVVVGGTAITGGYGSPLRTLTGVLIVTLLRTGVTVIGLQAGIEPLGYGLMMILALAITIDRSKVAIVK
jgi:ribose transport system permease protein